MINSANSKSYDTPEEYRQDLPLILIVDDEDPTRRMLNKLLSLNEYECISAENSELARLQLRCRKFDLMLCDVKMPGGSGIELLGHVKSEYPETAVLMLTGMDSPELAQEALAVGAYGYIIKPFKPNELVINISNAIRRRDLEKENRMHRNNLEKRIKEQTSELNITLEKARQTMSGIIQAMSLAVESRDPYTAGHQRRVSQLSAAIAVDMGFSDDRVEGIQMAGIVHDLGKIAVPAEILSKPGRITEIEFEMIKSHTLVGYDILKDIEFPWPISDVVVQHHEKLNGSGYPHGLKGDEILMESRILTVADVVEAMASHRPYRPALGIDVALEEISKNKGEFYDSDVARACLRLFNDKGFVFSDM